MEEYRKVYARIPVSLFYRLQETGIIGPQFDSIISDVLLNLVGELEAGNGSGKEFRTKYGIKKH